MIDLDLGPRSRAIGKRRQENRDFFEARELVAGGYAEGEKRGDPVQKRDLAAEAKQEAQIMGRR